MAGLIPVTLLTGFLGAGKTTLLNRLVRDPAFDGVAVVINEFGPVGVDHDLVEAADRETVLLASGCLCCTVRGDLVDALLSLAARRADGNVPPFRRVVIETSGLADPVPILNGLIGHPGLGAVYGIDGIVTVVDGAHGEATLQRHAESQRQVMLADRLVLSKRDLAGPATLAGLEARLSALNPAAPILAAEALRADELRAGELLADGPQRRRAPFLAEGIAHLAGPRGSVRALGLTSPRPIAAEGLDGFLALLLAGHGSTLLRLKGLVMLTEGPERPLVVQGVGHALMPPRRLPAWPRGEAGTRLALILEGGDAAAVEALFAACWGELRPDLPDAAALGANPLALR
jgi:G3E family GTPase